jgi:hypothetical protein
MGASLTGTSRTLIGCHLVQISVSSGRITLHSGTSCDSGRLSNRLAAVGKRFTIEVTLKAASAIKVRIMRHVPASGRGRHRHKARWALVETLNFSGARALNLLSVSTKPDGHELAAGKYEAIVSAGAGSHTVSFTIKGRPRRRSGHASPGFKGGAL